MTKTVKYILCGALATVLLVGGGVLAGLKLSGQLGRAAPAGNTAAEVDSSAQDWQGEQPVYTGPKNTDTIDIPGFGSMTLKANSAQQAVNLNNPVQNTCYFQMSLLLADGTQLWQSKLIEPGKALYDITLDQTLPAGDYENATLKYECFAMDEEQTPLNGSEIKLTLHVID